LTRLNNQGGDFNDLIKE